MKILKNTPALLLLGGMILLSSCGKERSGSTGWAHNDLNNGGFEKAPFVEQETGPGLVLIEGGTFTMGRVEDDVNFNWDNIPRRVTVSSFYMDETEVTNLSWLEYLYWLNRIYGDSYPEIVNKALPDTLVWREKMEYNEPYVDYYLRHPAYRNYPVVGVSWLQASDYCSWRSDRVNELILIREGLLNHNPAAQVDEDHFTTDAYYAGQYEGDKAADGIEDLNPNGSGFRNVKMEDGILLPRYRLPTEAEWEYAAKAMIGTQYNDENQSHARLYPWNGHTLRNAYGQTMGTFMANFKRGRGDYAGIAGKLNDGHMITCEVFEFPANDYGLYNMAGNVNEWVMDLYRPLSFNDMEDLNPVRKNNFQDGDDPNVYLYDKANYTTFIGQNSQDEDVRVYKGGSWKDVAYWLSPGTRRYLEADSSTADIGFRCAMIKADAIDN